MTPLKSERPLAAAQYRAGLQAPRLLSEIRATPGFVMGNRAFMRAWAARRAARELGSASGASKPEMPATTEPRVAAETR